MFRKTSFASACALNHMHQDDNRIAHASSYRVFLDTTKASVHLFILKIVIEKVCMCNFTICT